MVTGADLRALLDACRPPAEGGYTTKPLEAVPQYQVGRGAGGVVVLLTPPDGQPDPPIRLQHLSLDPRIRCRLETAGEVVEEEHGVVELRPDDDMVEPFLDVAAALVRLLGPQPQPGAVSRGMRRLIRLFDATKPPRGSVLGLWGELLVLSVCSDPVRLTQAWHADVDARFDFAEDGSRLEVKTTAKGERVHQFSLPQLLPVEGAVVHVASLITTASSNGTSIGELMARLEARLGAHPSLQVVVHEQVADVLGPQWFRHCETRFDATQATATLAVLRAEDVPRVEPGSPEVLRVDLQVDCSRAPAMARVKIGRLPGLASLLTAGSAGN